MGSFVLVSIKTTVAVRNSAAPTTGAYLCFPVPMFPGTDVPRTYVPRCLCSPVPMFPGFCHNSASLAEQQPVGR